MPRRLLAVALLAAVAVIGPVRAVHAAGVQDPVATTDAPPSTEHRLPRTDLEAEERGGDDEGFGASWMVGAGVASAALVLVGGLWLQRTAAQQDGRR